MSDANLPVSDGSFTDSGPNTAVSFDVTTWSCDGYTQRSVLPDWVVSEPQNQVDTRSRSRSRPPLTDDRRRIDRVEESTRGPTGVASSSQLPVPERSTSMIPTHGLFYHSHNSSGSLVETHVMQQIPAVSQIFSDDDHDWPFRQHSYRH